MSEEILAMLKTPSTSSTTLRQRAEENIRREEATAIPSLSLDEARQMLHELRVHQIEMEIQNEELRRTQQELEASRSRYFELYDLAPVGYLTLSKEGLIEMANLRVTTMLGVERKNLLRKPISSFILREDQDLYYLHKKKVLDTGMLQAWEQRMLLGNGSPFWVHLQITQTTSGEYSLILLDVTRRKESEQENEKLAALLHQAQKMELAGRLAGGVAHDFNNMLGVIIGYTELATMHLESGEPIQPYLKEIRKAAEHSTDLTRQLLSFARKQTIKPLVLHLNEVTAASFNILQRLIGENIQLDWHPAEDLWLVKADPTQIEQILTNICINARDAIPDVGRITIKTENCTVNNTWCDAHLAPASGEYVRLSISDNGCGMDSADLEHIFEPFFTTKGIGGGTGLGLATVFGAVKQNNGFINVESKVGKGTTLTIYLPRFAEKNEMSPLEQVAKPGSRGDETILLVEDNPRILEMTTLMLKELGYRVLPAMTPVRALCLASEHTGEIDLLLSDVVMPEMDGQELTKKLLISYPHLKTLFMSGYAADIITTHGVLAEGIHFIQKPFTMEGLDSKVRKVLETVC